MAIKDHLESAGQAAIAGVKAEAADAWRRVTNGTAIAGLAQNPGDPDDDAEDDDGDEIPWLDFDLPGGLEDNKAAAAGSYRVLGDPDDGSIIAWHPASGKAFFGTMDQLDEMCEDQSLKSSDFEYEDDPSEILKMDYDPDSLEDALAVLNGEEGEEAADDVDRMYVETHWGDEPTGFSMIAAEGVKDPLAFFGIVRNLTFAPDDEAEVTYHHGKSTDGKVFPTLWTPAHGKYYIVYGSGYRIAGLLKAAGNPSLVYDQHIDGIDEPMAAIGDACHVEYYAKKGGKCTEFEHTHGENSDTYPLVLVPKHGQWYCVAGGRMRIEDRGIID